MCISLPASSQNLNCKKSLAGFTIVELLIVVVVIAILATVAISAYSGVQEKAWNAKAVSNASSFRDVLLLYVVEHGAYPNYGYTRCLGSGYTDRNGDGLGDCVVNADGSVDASQSPAGSDPLISIMGNAAYVGDGPYLQRPSPAPDNQFFALAGVRYMYWNEMYYNGAHNPNWLVYIIRGKGVDCRRPLALVSSGNYRYFTDSTASAAKGEAWKECYEPLPPI